MDEREVRRRMAEQELYQDVGPGLEALEEEPRATRPDGDLRELSGGWVQAC